MITIRKRYLEPYLQEDLQTKMVFIGGPRQVGKTTIALDYAKGRKHAVYLNWDNREQKHKILNQNWTPDNEIIIFDELHKYKNWKSYIKGVWDTRTHNESIIVTGSSRLDIFRKGGDSLLGRYHYYRLHPFTLSEIEKTSFALEPFSEDPPDLIFDKQSAQLDFLINRGGFPEPLLNNSERLLKRWHTERLERIFREDIRESENIQQIGKLELLGLLLPTRVGSPLSMTSLVEDIEVSVPTLNKWLELLCRNYYIYKVPPYHKRLERALKKEAKYYLWDWSEIKEKGPRFENMIASHLLKFCHYYHDLFGLKVELFYLRDREKREVDFLVLWEGTPWFIVECKLEYSNNLTSLAYFADKLRIKNRYLVTQSAASDFLDKKTGIRIIPAAKFLLALI